MISDEPLFIQRLRENSERGRGCVTVLETVRAFLCERCGCEAEDVELAASFDELNVADFEREALALLLEEAFEIYIPETELSSFETVEDLVGYVEDRF